MHPPASAFDPVTLFDTDVLRDPSQVEVAVNKELIEPTSSGGWMIPFLFRSQVWNGAPWDHPCRLYLPPGLSPQPLPWAFIHELPPDMDGGDVSVDLAFGQELADALGIPVVVIGALPPAVRIASPGFEDLAANHPDCFDTLLGAPTLLACARQLLLDTGDLRWAIELPLARALVRTVTAAHALPQAVAKAIADGGPEVPPLTAPSLAIVGAAGERGRALPLAALLDDRIAGIWIAEADMADFDAFFDLVATRWGGQHPEWGDVHAWQEFLATDAGAAWKTVADPAGYWNRLEGRAVEIVRTANDSRFPLGALAAYANALPSNTEVRVIARGSYTFATKEHLASWRRLVWRVLHGGPPVRVEVDVTPSASGEATVTARVHGLPPHANTKALAWWTHAQSTVEDADLRDAEWVSSPLALARGAGGTWSGTSSVGPGSSPLGIFIELQVDPDEAPAYEATSVPAVIGP